MITSFERSDIARTLEHDGTAVAVFGRAPFSASRSDRIVWMLATDGIEAIERGFILSCKPEIARLRQGCSRLLNLTHRDNAVVLRWLRWLGFTIEPQPCGPGGEFFMFWLAGAPDSTTGGV